MVSIATDNVYNVGFNNIIAQFKEKSSALESSTISLTVKRTLRSDLLYKEERRSLRNVDYRFDDCGNSCHDHQHHRRHRWHHYFP